MIKKNLLFILLCLAALFQSPVFAQQNYAKVRISIPDSYQRFF